MGTWIALLRGINVGGVKYPMTELRAALEAAGATDVQTYIQSGNAVFAHPARSEAEVKAAVEAAIAEAGPKKPVPTMIRSATQWRGVVDANPYEPDHPTHLHVSFFDEPLPKDSFSAIDLDAFAPETFTVHGREVYLHLPNGMGRSKLAVELNKGGKKAPVGTSRNWNTVLKLADLSSG
jgi:uncharacterized protein (DUF1697 family)